jgi:hypothetical protein
MEISTLTRNVSQFARLLAVLGLACASSTSVAETPVVNNIQTLLAGDGWPSGLFGRSVDVDADTALIGASNESYTGAAYVFTRDASGVWYEQAKLRAGDAASDDLFGVSVSLDADTALIGAPNESRTGAAYIYTRNGSGEWSEQAKLLAGDASRSDRFGHSVALTGDTAVIGAWEADSNGLINNGAAYVFTRDVTGAWSEQAKLLASDAASMDYFGQSVAVDGNTVLVGAESESSNGLLRNGAAYVFTRDASGAWSEQAKLLAVDRAAGDLFGRSVAIDGDTALIGAFAKDSTGLENNGAAYVFTRSMSGEWAEQAKLLPSETTSGDLFGSSVALDGDTALIGAWGGYINAYVFERDAGGTWSEKARLLAIDAASEERYAEDVALSRATAIAGAATDPTFSPYEGAAYVFDLTPLIAPMEVAIDIKPGNRRNVMNPRSRGRFWLAILSDAEFDALQVDPATVALGAGEASPDRYRVKRVNRDRLPDLMLRFRTPEVGLQCGDTEVDLSGEIYAGDSVIGLDKVKTVGCKKKPKKGKKR